MAETHEKRTKTHACDLISRQAAIDAVKRVMVIRDKRSVSVCDAIKALPSAQPVNIANLQPTCNQLATDTISRQEAQDFISTMNACNDISDEAYQELMVYFENLPSAQPNLSEAYSKAIFTWLMDYQIRAAELKGRYTPYEVLSWVINDWRKENG